MIRKIITIDEAKCNGCGKCALACHEGAIKIIQGKAKLTREDYCDGLGDCLPACPTGAISFEEREALSYNEQAVLESKKKAALQNNSCGCPGSQPRQIFSNKTDFVAQKSQNSVSYLRQWPVQIKLVPTQAPYFKNAHLLIAADCTAYTYGSFHADFMQSAVTIIGCPKLDAIDYSEKLTEILTLNEIKTLTVARMEVPCCGGIEMAVKRALQACEKTIPLKIVTISTDGKIVK
ncbi:MAG: 4Fe-4S ferredoxin [Spirochaetaceae bacterium]|nr:4Fe-4S ferredoxin [Spirochaetaceae bacterium]